MIPRRTTLAALAVLASLASLAATSRADTLMALKSHVDAFELAGRQQPARDTEVKIWLDADRFSRQDANGGAIVRLDTGKLYLLDHGKKTYSVVGLPVDLRDYLPPQAVAQLDAMAERMKMSVQVKPTDEHEKVGSWDARKFEVEISNAAGMKVDVAMWTAKETGVPRDAYDRLMTEIISLQPGAKDWMEKVLKEVDGVPVRQTTVSSFGGHEVKSSEEVVSVSEEKAPEGTYEPPAGYTEIPFDPMSGGPPASH